ncbi:MAG: hypothetical protein IPK82_43650 [Polyangiaceae bacterium]|nr:hypothetical protein [Polyangiaceae bacterium]
MARMPVCKECDSEVETLKTVKVGAKKKKVCESCADRMEEEQTILEESEGAIQQMMGFKGKR